MPEPISSSSNSPSPGLGADPTVDEAGQVCRSDAPNSSEPSPLVSTPPAVSKLVSAVPPPASSLPPAASAPLAEAHNNAQRTTERAGSAPYAAAGWTGSAHDSLFAGVAALKGRDPKTGIEVEVFSASAQVAVKADGENEAQVGMARMGISGKHGSATTEFFTARLNSGAHNDDGSKGINVGALATIAGMEGTLNIGAGSLTLGLAAGTGEAFSAGARDIDGDGVSEWCAKASIGELTLGFCTDD
jgi:hypothetical protein